MNHSFNIDDAKKYGVECAIILENFRYWIAKNKANNKHFYDGRYWTYNSVKAFSELFPYWSDSQIRRYLEKLESEGVISTGNFNNSSYDRTKWYCLNDKNDLANLPNGIVENANSYTNINTDVNTNTNEPLVEDTEKPIYKIEADFDVFWHEYPRHENKKKAQAVWLKLKPDLEKVLNALEWQMPIWEKDDNKFAPHPTTYINNERWNDEPPKKPQTEEIPEWRRGML